MATTRWPKEVPVLEASDICRGRMIGGDGTHCLIGWSWHCFEFCRDAINSSPQKQKVFQAIHDEIARLCGHGYRPPISEFNDDTRNDTAILARVWNRAMARLGYRVGNPESRYVRRK